MKFRLFLLSLTVALLASACTNTRYATNGEYDDVYFTSADRSAQVASEDLEGPEVYGTNDDERRYSSNTSRDDYRVNSYKDEVYDEDDFYFSRRLRRFGSASSSAWRYYDPYYSNDLYYVMGTSSWSPWRNNGWYSWNRPRFGSSLNWNYYSDPFYSGIYDTWGMNYGNYYNYYNPWVSTYYGYAPSFGYNPYGFGSSFNRFGYGGFGFGGYGYGSAFYCPPYAYTSAAGVSSSRSRSWDRYYTGRRQSSTSSVRTNTGYGSSSRVSPSTNDRRQTARPAGYSSTRTNSTSNSGMYLAPKARTQTISNRSNISTTSPNSTRPTTARPANRTSPRVYTRPNSNTSSRINSSSSNIDRRSNARTRTNNSYTRPSNSNRTYSRPSNRTYTRPSNTNRTYSRPSNSNRTYSRPSNSSSRPSSTISRPSSSRPSSTISRPSSSRPSSARPSSSSSSRRPSGSRSSSSSSSSRVRP